jgi:hypothetical protein
MPTKLNQDQVSGLTEELSSLDSIDESLESKISTEDSINDEVDVDLQGQIDELKHTMLSLVFGQDLYVQNDGPDLIVYTVTNPIISISSTTWNWYLNDEEISGANSNIYRPLQTGYYKAKVSYQTSLGLHIVQSSPYYMEVSDRPTY